MKGFTKKRWLRFLISWMIAFSVMPLLGGVSVAEVQIPEVVRVGLYFNDSATRINTAVASFDVDSANGIALGYLKENQFVKLLENESSQAVTIKKDVFLGAENQTGAYHIQIKDVFSDLSAVQKEIERLNSKGVEAYPAYTGVWRVWTGSFLDAPSAQKYISETMVKKVGKDTYTVVEPHASSVLAVSGEAKVLLAYQGEENFLQVIPRLQKEPNFKENFSILNVNHTPYRGSIEVRRLSTSDMTVMNIVSMEEYLYGVVPAEIGTSAHEEALKAQAITARTYAVNTMWKYKKYGFNLCTTTNTQVYKGYAKESERTNKAVDETKGRVITYGEKAASVFFFSSSGGRTEDAKNVWGYEYAHLKSVEDKYESDKLWNYYWEKSFTRDQIKETLLNQGMDIGDITEINVTKLSDAGRPIEMVIKGTKNPQGMVYTNAKCRSAWGQSLPSQWFEISTDIAKKNTVDPNESKVTPTEEPKEEPAPEKNKPEVKKKPKYKVKVVFPAKLPMKDTTKETGSSTLTQGKTVSSAAVNRAFTSAKTTIPAETSNNPATNNQIPSVYKVTGRGYGHAVGMSQNGAMGMAKAGFTCDEIIKHYFTGVNVSGSPASPTVADQKSEPIKDSTPKPTNETIVPVKKDTASQGSEGTVVKKKPIYVKKIVFPDLKK